MFVESSRPPAGAGEALSPVFSLSPALPSPRAWIFDLDNTLYSQACGLWQRIDARITLFIETYLQVSRTEAHARQKAYFSEYGTSLKGLVEKHGIDPDVYQRFVYDVDYRLIPSDPGLIACLERLEGPKYIYTNASRAHVVRVLHQLSGGSGSSGSEQEPAASHGRDIEETPDWLSGCFDIHDSGLLPKPSQRAFEAMLAHFGLTNDARETLFVDDLPQNLVTAKLCGVQTGLIRQDSEEPAAPPAAFQPDYARKDLRELLAAVRQNPG